MHFMAKLYLVLTVLGIILPLYAFVSWLIAHGFNVALFVSQIVDNKISLFAWLDVIVAAVVSIIFIVTNGAKHHIPNRWLAILGTLTVGVSCGLPLYLYLRERHLKN